MCVGAGTPNGGAEGGRLRALNALEFQGEARRAGVQGVPQFCIRLSVITFRGRVGIDEFGCRFGAITPGVCFDVLRSGCEFGISPLAFLLDVA